MKLEVCEAGANQTVQQMVPAGCSLFVRRGGSDGVALLNKQPKMSRCRKKRRQFVSLAHYGRKTEGYRLDKGKHVATLEGERHLNDDRQHEVGSWRRRSQKQRRGEAMALNIRPDCVGCRSRRLWRWKR